MGRLHRRGVLLATALGLFALFPASAGAGGINERFAEPGGNGPAVTCSLADPCSLEDAVESVTVDPGDTITVLPGTYALGANELTMAEGTILRGAPGQARPLLTSTSANAVVAQAGAGPATIRRLKIVHTGTTIGLALGESTQTAEQVLVNSSGFVACTGRALWRDSVCVLDAPSTGLGAVGLTIGGVATGTMTLRNVTAVSSVAGIAAVRLNAFGGADLTIDAKNVIAHGTDVDALATTDSAASTSAALTFTSSNYDAASATGTLASVTPAGSAGNQSALPLFVNLAGGDYHQLSTSPTVNAGTADALLGAADLDAGQRTVGCAVDIGAYELASGPACPPAKQAAPKKKCKKKKKKKSAAAAKKKKCKKRKKR